jgi:muramidase (phage lysozyme)
MTIAEKAFLDTLSFAEGTLGIGNNGYDVLLNTGGGKSRLINKWTADTTINHQLNDWRVEKLDSNAAGRYQFIGSTWIEMNNNVNKPMTKDNQDIAALKLLRIKLGSSYNFEINISDETKGIPQMQNIVDKIKKTWASFEPSVNTTETLYGWYKIAYGKYS